MKRETRFGAVVIVAGDAPLLRQRVTPSALFWFSPRFVYHGKHTPPPPPPPLDDASTSKRRGIRVAADSWSEFTSANPSSTHTPTRPHLGRSELKGGREEGRKEGRKEGRGREREGPTEGGRGGGGGGREGGGGGGGGGGFSCCKREPVQILGSLSKKEKKKRGEREKKKPAPASEQPGRESPEQTY